MSLSAAKGVIWSFTTPFAVFRDVPPKFGNLLFPSPNPAKRTSSPPSLMVADANR